MEMEQLSSLLWELETDERYITYVSPSGIEVSATRTNKICPHDFAVGLTIPGRTIFYPTHIRLFIDLYLKQLSNHKESEILWQAFEEMFKGADPTKHVTEVAVTNYRLQLDTADVNLCYGQLLMIEQDFNYGPNGCKKSNYEPPRLFNMGFIRWIFFGQEEIDRILTAAVRNWPPPRRFTT